MKLTIPGENSILLRGRLLAAPVPSHQNHQIQFFLLPLEVCRLSGAADKLDVIASQRLLETLPPLQAGQRLQIAGEVRTYNNRSGVGRRLVITVYARSILPAELEEDENQLTLAGCDDRRELPFHKMLLNGELPLTMGGGIGQSRVCMLMIGTCHIGEVQASQWDKDTVDACQKAGILLL